MGEGAHRLLVIGDIGVDLVLGPLARWPEVGTEVLMERSELRAGGAAGNTALAVAYLGGQCRLLSVTGCDAAGHWLREQFAGIDAQLEECPAHTTLSVGLLHACGDRTFLTTRGHLEHLALPLLRRHLVPAGSQPAVALLSGVFLTPALRGDYPALIEELRALGYAIAIDTNWPPQDWDAALRAEVRDWIGRCDHVLLNELEVRRLADTEDLTAAVGRVAKVLRPGATLAVKLGAAGALGVQDGRRCQVAAPRATVFDSIGAGDGFNAGYLLARLEGAELAAALAAGCRAATAIITRFPRRELQAGELSARPALMAAT